MGVLGPTEVVRILSSAYAPEPDPRLAAVLRAFERHWTALGHRLRPDMAADVADAVQVALEAVVDPRVLAQLRDPASVQGWARSLFCHKLSNLARQRGRDRRRYVPLPGDVEDALDDVRTHLTAQQPTPEEQAIARQRLAIVSRCLDELPLARAKFVDDLPDKDLAIRFGKTHDAVRNYLKRVRQALRTAIADRT